MLGVGLEGALLLVSPAGALAIGVAALLAGGASYAAALGPMASRERPWSRWAVGLVGAFLLAEGLRLVAPAGTSSLGLAILAVSAAVMAGRWTRSALAAHAALFTGAALVTSGHAATTVAALSSSAQGSWEHPWVLGGVVLVLSTCAWGVLARRAPEGMGPRSVLAALILLGLAGLAVLLLAPPIAGVPDEGADAGVLAVVRTFVICALALGLAVGRRWWALPELTWGAYIVLGIAAIKLLVEDLVQGRPATLVLSMLFFGGSLAAVSWLLRGLHVFSLEAEEVR